jgi:glycosyltransferase involved in cell wall biosynthesis
MEPIFSVIIPTYNRSMRLRKALNSLVSQTFKNFEVIICDDGSIDNTKEVVDEFKSLLVIKYLWNQNWGGPARPRNIGIANSSGQWICFLDSDDWWYPQKLEICLKYIENYDLLYHVVDIFSAKTNNFTRKKFGRYLGPNPFKELIIYGNGIANSSVVVKKSICLEIGEISEEVSLVSVEDYDYWLRVCQKTSKLKFINDPMSAYFWDDSSNISQISINRIDKEITIFNKYLNYLTSKDQKKAKLIFNYKIGRYYGVLGDFCNARKYLNSSMKSSDSLIKLKSIIYFLKYRFK